MSGSPAVSPALGLDGLAISWSSSMPSAKGSSSWVVSAAIVAASTTISSPRGSCLTLTGDLIPSIALLFRGGGDSSVELMEMMLPERGRFSTRRGFYAGGYERRPVECDESSLTLTLAAVAGFAGYVKSIKSRRKTMTESPLTVRGIGRSCSGAGTASVLLRR